MLSRQSERPCDFKGGKENNEFKQNDHCLVLLAHNVEQDKLDTFKSIRRLTLILAKVGPTPQEWDRQGQIATKFTYMCMFQKLMRT